ncbi:MAG: DUF4836 family protein [Prevotellaceae bacterium]|jgi:hypothetical protein|nr:DUF4836 family protein [Prevotellaceae bacterium]
MKFVYTKIFILLFIIGQVLVSCKDNGTEENQLSFIPNNASFVIEFDGKEILTKSGLNKPDDYKFLNILKLSAGENYNFLELLLKGSKDAGISIDKITAYMTDIPEFTALVPVVDKTAFENWLKKTDVSEPTDEGSFFYLAGFGYTIAWNENLLIVSSVDAKDKIAELFKPQKDGLLATNDDFRQFTKKVSDIRMWFKYDWISTVYTQYLGVSLDVEEEVKDLSLHSYLDFKDGKIEVLSNYYPPEEVEKLKAKYPVYKNNFDKKLFEYLPEKSYFAFNLSLNVEESFKLVKKYIGNALQTAVGIYGFDIADQYDEAVEFLDSPQLKSVIDALAGDALFSLHGFQLGMISIPLLSLDFTLKNDEAFNTLLALIPQNRYRLQDNYYTISQSLVPVYFAHKDRKVIVSNDIDVVKRFAGSVKEKNFTTNPISNIMAEKMAFYLNLNWEDYPDNIKLLLQSEMRGQYKMFVSLIEIYENVYTTMSEDYKMEFVLQFKNKNVNSLKQILKSVDKVIPSF